MHKLYTLFFILILTVSKSVGQCLITCNQNVGVFSNNDPNTIGYDNMTSSFHSSIASEELGFRVWGERMLNNGTANALSPIYINSTNYPALTGTIYFAGVGSNSLNNVQMIVLTSTGLFASGNPGAVLSTTIKNTAPFQKVTVNGKTDGLPAGITPDSVKMMFVSFQTIILTTCGGRVFVLSQQTNVRGDIGNATQWSPVKMTNGQPLTGIVAARGNTGFAFALKNDNTLWTWGNQVRLGNGTGLISSNFAIQMTPPTGVSRIKMIQGTSSSASNQSYYVLDTTNKVFALGENNNGQLADNTVTDRNVWISCLYSNGTIVNNAKWISSNEHDPLYPNIGIISSTSQMRTAGNNSRWMIGRTTDAGTNNLNFPTGINATDTITFCEVGGHTSAFIKKNTPRYGYVGHHINGSIGNNSAIDNEITSVNFIIPPIISICGTVCDTPIITKKPFNCNDSIATFIIKGRRNNIVRFNLNGVNDSVIIGNNDTAIISRVKPNGDLALNITQINSLYCNLSLAIKDTLKLSTKKDSFITICRNKSIFFNQQVISTSGLYRDTLTNVYGCDSFLNLFITVKDTSKKDSFLTICQPNTIFFNNQTISVSGVYKDTLINSQGCDSILTLNLTVNPKTFGSFSQNICQGSSFLFNGINRSVSGSFLDTLVNSKGCDSILTLNLTVNPKTFGTINQTICQGSSFLFNGINRTISGSYLDTLVNAKGCDSILTLNLTVNPKTFSTINQTICEGSSFLGRTNSGTYIDTLISGNAKGCDSIRTLVLTVNPKTFGTINQTICEGSSFLFNGVNQSVSGAYLDTLINAKGCDSILTLNLTVNPKTFGSFSQIICQGSSFLFNGINRTVSGAYMDTLINVKGCDSILTLNLTVNPKTFGTINQTICQGSSFLFNGINRTISGAYLDTLVNAKSCDSILTLNLTVNPKTFSTINQTICEGSSFLGRTSSGTYIDTIIAGNAKGCDSIRTLVLTVNPKTFGSINQTICEGSSFLFNGINRSISGSFLDTLVNSKGCDSILTLNLTVNPKTFGTINQTICEGSSFLGRTISGTYIDTLISGNAKGCDSIRTLVLIVNPKTLGSFSQTICEGSSFLFNGINRSVSGSFLDTLVNAKGCDSIITLNLTVNSISNSTFYQSICLGDTFMGKTTSGIYIDTIKNGNSKGCDSIRTLNLTVNSTQKPGISIIPNPNCSNKNATISAITPSGSYIYSWTVPSGQSSPGNVSSFTTNIAGIYRLNVKTKTSILCNTDFENNQVISGSNFLITNQNNVPCWKTTASDSMIEVWSNGFSGVPSYSGNQFVELNANMVSTLFQNFIAKSGNQIEISFAHRGRAGTDVMSVEIGKIGGPYTNLGNFSAGNTAWVFNSLIYTIPNTISDTNFTLRFNSVSAAGGATIGNFLDAIDIKIISCKSEDTSVQLVINPISTSIINQTICQGNSFLGRTSSGTYIDTLVNTKGCDSVRTLNLTVNPKTFGTINQTICEGSSFLFKGVNRTVSGAYLDTLVNAKGCDSILTLNLTVNPKTFGTTNQTICQGSSVLFNGINRTISGSYLDTLVNAKGCDSILTLNLTVNPKTSSTINQTICEGSSLLGRTTSGTYIDTLIGANAKGCDSIRTLVLTVNPKTFGSFSQTICEGSSVLFNGIIRTISGSYLDTLVNAKGCDSILTLNLTVNPKTFGTTNQTICQGSSVLFNGINRTISGSYLDTLVNAKGCDSILTLNLTVNPKTSSTINQTICEGSSLLGRTTSGTYIDTLIGANAKGCDSIRTLVLTVNPKTFGSFSQTICEGSSVLFNGIIRTISGSYLDTLVNVKGCDSILTLNLTVNPKTFGSFSQTICESSSISFNGINRTISGAYLDTLVNAKGCDSILTLNLTVNPKTFGTINQTICEGSSVLFNGIIRTISGSYLDTLVNVKGCDSILTLNLTVNPKTFGSFSQTICESSSISFNGINRTISGAYLDTLVNAKGCDSILTLNLTVNPKTFGTINQTICQGSSVLFNSINQNISGIYLDTLVNAKGCDSILTLNLTVNPKTFGTTNQTICEGTSVLFNGINRTISGAYLDTLVNAKGCDSILTLNLIVNPKTISTINQTICEGSSFLGRTISGTYIDTLIGTNSKGCDSIRTLVLTVNPKTFGTINQTICQGSSVLFNGIIRTISGSYLDTLVNVKGCDSILTLNLTVNPKTFGSFSQTICEGSSISFNGINQTVSGAYLDTLVNAKGCDSILTLNLTVNPKTFGTINQTICEGSSLLFNGINQTVTGAYLDTLLNANGCDSILTLNLIVNPRTFGTTNQIICQGSSFLFNGINRTISGAYLDTLVNAKGCDSILTLNLTVNPNTSSTINQTICEGSSFLGRTISGTYIDTLIGANAKGCDSIRTLILTVNSKTFSNFKQTICQGDSFFSRTQTGIYHDTFVNAKGCDSIRTLSLIVNPISRTIINKTICEGDVFLGKSTTGIHLDTFKNQFGCDSVREINLLVLSPIRNNLNYEICQGESFRGQTKTSIFIDTIKNGLGCDSIIETVDLYVRPNIDSSFKIKICEGRSYRGKSAAGNYIDSFMNEYGCISIYRYELSLNQKTYGNETKTICYDQKYKGHTKSGIYRDTLTNQYGCDSIITLTLFVKSNFITKKLQDTTIKKGDTALLQAQKGFLYYTWNTSSTSAEIMVSIEGKYKVTIMNHDGCVGYDSCNVYIIPRDTSGTDTTVIDSIDGYAECPNVFTPNDDFKNDLFRPNFYGNVDVIRLLVYTRFGEKMYEGHGNFAAWDGIYKGEKCEPGVYVYFIEYKNNKGKHFAKGSVTLLR